MATSVYRHVQIGWWILAAGAAVPVVLIAASWPPDAAMLVPAGLLLLPLAWVATMTVTVTRECIDVTFGIGWLRRRVPLAHIRGWRVVRSPLYHGIGMRLIPHGTLCTVTAGPAVELLLDNDRILRIGTDEPGRLIDALSTVHRPAVPEYASVAMTIRPRAWRRAAAVALFVVLVALAAAAYRSVERPPRVSMSTAGLRIDAGVYSVDLPWTAVTDVSLEDTLPAIVRRTNGYALGGTLRGHFHGEGIGAMQLFVERDQPPFVRITSTTEGVVFIGLGQGGGTRQLFREISGVRAAVGRP